MGNYRLLHVLLIAFFLVVENVVALPFYVGPDTSNLATRTICASDDMQLMKNQTDDLKEFGLPIGRLKANTSSGFFYCSGAMVSPDTFLTARHCKAACANMSVQFGYLDSSVNPPAFPCKEIIEAGNTQSNQDYMLVKLEGSPGVEWGYYPLSDRELAPEEELMIVHHPRGKPMHVSLNECVHKKSANGMLRHRCDTEPGSSGSAILLRADDPTAIRVVGVHAFGGCFGNNPATSNYGPAIRSLAKISAEIRALIVN